MKAFGAKAKHFVDLIGKNRLDDAAELIKELVDVGFEHANGLIISDSTRSRLNWFLFALKNCVVKMRENLHIDLIVKISDILEALCKKCDLSVEKDIRTTISKLYQQLCVYASRVNEHSYSVCFSARAVLASGGLCPSAWKLWINRKYLAAKMAPQKAETNQNVFESCSKSVLCKWNRVADLLLMEVFWLGKLRSSFPSVTNIYEFKLLTDVLKSQPLPLERAEALIALSELAARSQSVCLDEASEYLREAFRVLGDVDECPSRLHCLCKASLLKFLQNLRALITSDFATPNPVVSCMKTNYATRFCSSNKFDAISGVDKFGPLMTLLKDTIELCQSSLIPRYASASANEKERITELVHNVAAVSLLYGNFTQAINMLFWLFTAVESVEVYQQLIAAFIVADASSFCAAFIDNFEGRVRAETEAEKLYVRRLRLFGGLCAKDVSLFKEVLDTISNCKLEESADLLSFRNKALCHLSVHCCAKRQCTAGNIKLLLSSFPGMSSALLSLKHMRSIMKYHLSEMRDDIQHFSANCWIDIALYLWLNKEVALAYEQAGLIRFSLAYADEGLSLSLRFSSPNWLCAFLGLLFEFESKLYEPANLRSYLSLGYAFYRFRPRPVAAPLACKTVRKLDFDNMSLEDSSEATNREKKSSVSDDDSASSDSSDLDDFGEFRSFLENRHKRNCNCWACGNESFQLAETYLIGRLIELSSQRGARKMSHLEKVSERIAALYQRYLKQLGRALQSLCPEDVFANCSCSQELDLNAAIRLSILNVSLATESVSKLKQRMRKMGSCGNASVYYRLEMKMFNFVVTSAAESGELTFVTPRTHGNGRYDAMTPSERKKRLDIENCIVEQLNVHALSLYSPWYARAHEWLALNGHKLDSWTVAYHLCEAIAVASRHLALLEHLSGKYDRTPEFPFIFNDVDSVKSCVSRLEKNWTVVTLYLTADEHAPDLVLLRMSSRCDPLIVNLGSAFEVYDALSELNELDKKNVRSIKLKDKHKFWAARFSCDAQMKKFLEHLEAKWFNVMTPLLRHVSSETLQSVKEELIDRFSLASNLAEALVNGWFLLNEKSFRAFSKQLVSLKSAQAIVKLLNATAKPDEHERVTNEPIIFILSKDLCMLPIHAIESLRQTPVTRVPSLHFLAFLVNKWNKIPAVVKENAFYVLNPTRDLAQTQKRFEAFFKNLHWQGCVGRDPTIDEIRSALKKDLFVYCGHGSGSRYIKIVESHGDRCHAIVLLMGCSSGRLLPPGRLYEPIGSVTYYQLAQCPNVVALLWDVTDKDTDRMLHALLTIWLQNSFPPDDNESGAENLARETKEYTNSLLLALNHARKHCKLKFLTGASILSYGLPVVASLTN
ncbi:Peptidase C50 domain containing protein [Trichuris trichiura]|uniref:separase n=1 Tax=Trichuris trichiura TaxID=36087 RepID=A0A077YZ62_TRITR|nr:Peptidase C50 domain containing protein [Trichuris trichiura]